MKKQLLTLACIAAVLTACEPNNFEQDAIIASLSEKEQLVYKLEYDRALLRAYEHGKSLQLAHNAVRDFIPNKTRNTAAHYLLKRHAKKRLEESRTFNKAEGRALLTQKESEKYTYDIDFPQKLRAEVQNTELKLRLSTQKPLLPTHGEIHEK